MLVNKFFGYGIVFGICQKVAIDIINKQQQKIKRLGRRLNVFGLFHVNLGVEAGQILNHGLFHKDIDKIIDDSTVIVGIANSLFNPGYSIFIGLCYLFIKSIKFGYKVQQRDPVRRRQTIELMDIVRILLFGFSTIVLLIPNGQLGKTIK